MIYGIDSNSPSANLIAAIPDLKTTQVPEWVWSQAAGASAGDVIQFVVRYLTAHSNANLNITEVLKLSDAGLRVVSVFEEGNSESGLTADNGYAQGSRAWPAAARVSQPLGTPIYFAIDLSTGNLSAITDYFDGVRKSLNDYNAAQSITGQDAYAIGVYGQPNVCTHCRDTDSTVSPGNKLATYFWRWGGFGPWPGANFEQLYGERFYGTRDKDPDPSRHFYGATGHVVGEKFCGLGVDFNMSEMDSLDQIGAWLIPQLDQQQPADDASSASQ